LVVNTPAPHGSIGHSTKLFPSMSLGCGTPGGNITSDNISPLHLVNIKRLAYERRPVNHQGDVAAGLPRQDFIPPQVDVAAGLPRQDFIPHQRDVAQASTRRAEEAAVPAVSGPPGGTYASPSPHSAPATSLTAPPAQPDPAEISRILERFLSPQGRMPGAS